MVDRKGKHAVKRIVALHAVRRLPGRAQSQLMLGDDARLWVVKFKNNPLGSRILANEFVASRLGVALGLSMPETCVVEVDSWLVKNTQDMWVNTSQGERVACSDGANFGSLYANGLDRLGVASHMPQSCLWRVRNINEFAGVLALDKWLCNMDKRQAIFTLDRRSRRYHAWFIDQSSCFGGAGWVYADAPDCGVFNSKAVYEHISGWKCFEPWLARIEGFSPAEVYDSLKDLPAEWYGSERESLEALVEQLIVRRTKVRDRIADFRATAGSPFRNWTCNQRPFASNFLM